MAVLFSTDHHLWTAPTADSIDLTWDDPAFRGIPFLSASGTEITFAIDCTVVVTVQARFFASYPAEGIMVFFYNGTVLDDAEGYPSLAGDAMSVPFYTVIEGQSHHMAWTSPPFRVYAGTWLGIIEQGNVASGTSHDVGTMCVITRVA